MSSLYFCASHKFKLFSISINNLFWSRKKENSNIYWKRKLKKMFLPWFTIIQVLQFNKTTSFQQSLRIIPCLWTIYSMDDRRMMIKPRTISTFEFIISLWIFKFLAIILSHAISNCKLIKYSVDHAK